MSYQVDYVEFYITNICNFDCRGCNRFNNYNFRGHQLWSDYQYQYQAWSKLLDIKRIGILGGEPMVNPTYLDWLAGVHQLWPTADIIFLTNGSMLRADNQRLYNIISGSRGRIKLNIGLHDIDRRDSVTAVVREWLHGDITETDQPAEMYETDYFSEQRWKESYQAVRDPGWPDCATVDEWANLPQHIQQECEQQHGLSPKQFASPALIERSRRSTRLQDSNGVTVEISNEDYFHQGALIPDHDNGVFRLHQSDVTRAHAICHSKYCHHFANGRLYKCGPAALFPELAEQFDFELTDQQQNLVHGYLGAEPTWDQSRLARFFDNLRNPIDQCSLCPEHYEFQTIKSQVRKVHFQRRTKQ